MLYAKNESVERSSIVARAFFLIEQIESYGVLYDHGSRPMRLPMWACEPHGASTAPMGLRVHGKQILKLTEKPVCLCVYVCSKLHLSSELHRNPDLLRKPLPENTTTLQTRTCIGIPYSDVLRRDISE